MKTVKTAKAIMTTGIIAIMLTSTAILSGCAGASKEGKGAVVGSVIGGVVGHQLGGGRGKTAMTIIGAIAGGMIGGNIGRGLDQQDQQRVNQSLETAPNNQKVAWENPNTKTNYEFTPTNKYDGNVNGQPTCAGCWAKCSGCGVWQRADRKAISCARRNHTWCRTGSCSGKEKQSRSSCCRPDLH